MDNKNTDRRLEEMLRAYAARKVAAFHMPGHKRVTDPLFGAGDLTAYEIDITEIPGFDDLHAPDGILKDEQGLAAELYGARSAYFSVNGSTGAILAGMFATVGTASTSSEDMSLRSARFARNSLGTCLHPTSEVGGNAVNIPARIARETAKPPAPEADCGAAVHPARNEGKKSGERSRVRILMERSCHRAVYHAAELMGAEVSFIEDGETPEAMAAERFDVDLLVITSPGYDGVIKDVAGYAKRAKESGALLYVDAAHGAHLGFHPALPASPVTQGADLVNVSLHKTLPALTQTALLLNVSGRVPDAAIRHYFDIFVSSSPSYVLMASMTAALHLVEDEGEALFADYATRLMALRKKLAREDETTEGFRAHLVGGADAKLAEGEYPPYAAGTKLDPGKLLFDLQGEKSAENFAAHLRKNDIECEWVKGRYVLLMTSVADTEEMVERLIICK